MTFQIDGKNCHPDMTSTYFWTHWNLYESFCNISCHFTIVKLKFNRSINAEEIITL